MSDENVYAVAVTMALFNVSLVYMHNLHTIIHVADLQDHSQEAEEEHVRSLPSQAEHMAHVGTSRLDAVQKGKLKEGTEDEDKEGCHADGSTHGLSTYNRHSTEGLLERVYTVGEEDSNEDLLDSSDEEEDSDEDQFDSSEEEEDLLDSSEEEEDSSEEEDEYWENYSAHANRDSDSDDEEDYQVMEGPGGDGAYSDVTVCSSLHIVMRSHPLPSEESVQLR